jgi:hypothetical protein
MKHPPWWNTASGHSQAQLLARRARGAPLRSASSSWKVSGRRPWERPHIRSLDKVERKADRDQGDVLRNPEPLDSRRAEDQIASSFSPPQEELSPRHDHTGSRISGEELEPPQAKRAHLIATSRWILRTTPVATFTRGGSHAVTHTVVTESFTARSVQSRGQLVHGKRERSH